MRKMKIVADSSADVLELQNIPFASAPLKIITTEGEFTDDSSLDVEQMVRFFDSYKGRSQTACPSPADWLTAFDDADDVFCVTITSKLSGSYNSACVAKQMFESENKGKRVYIIDSLSAGPELKLIIEKLEEYIGKGLSYEDICLRIQAYTQKTALVFALQSLKNMAANGRVSPAVARIAGLLNIRIVGRASDQGELQPLNKCRGEAKSLSTLLMRMKEYGLSKGKVRITHCMNEPAALKLKNMIRAELPKVDVQISKCRGLCSFYAEKGGLMIGCEKF